MIRSLYLVLAIVTIAALCACQFRSRPDLKQSTLTQPSDSATCVKGHKALQTGSVGAYRTPVVEVTSEPCEVKP